MFDIQNENGIAIIWLDQEGERVNTLSTQALREFAGVLDTLEQSPDIKAAILISRKKDSFIVGADIKEFAAFQTKEEVITLIREGQALFNRLESFKKPVVAAIHGACVGGGLELVMACSYRLATEHKRTLFALPEANLGLLPGLGGTQRLPRLVGLQQGLEMILTGKNVYAKPARKMGLVDAIIHPAGLLEAAKRAAQGLVDGSTEHKQRKVKLTETLLEKTPLNNIIYNKAAETVQEKTKGNYPAPPKIIETVRTGMTKGFKAGLEAEVQNFSELVFTPQSKALRHLFFAKNAAEKNPYKSVAKSVKNVGVLGAGLMGSGIAQVSTQAGYSVLLKDQTLEFASKGKGNIYKDVSKRVGKGMSDFERDEIVGRVTPVIDYDKFNAANLTFEAVLETLELKQQVLRDVEAVAPEGHVFATNTSSIPIGQIATNAQHPEAVLGMHYFSPVPKMPLLEIIKTDKTADWALGTAIDVGLKQGKTPIVVGDKPGFYANRILFPYMDEGLKLLQEGATVDAVDDAMTAFGFPVGPLKLLDEVGIDVGAHVTGVIAPLFAERNIQMVTVSDEILKAGLKGRKSGKGFYSYADDKSQGVNAEIYKYFPGERKTIPRSEIQERLFLAMVNEAVYCLQDNVIASPRDGDVGAVFGIGFPPFLGGPFFYVDQQGAANVVERLNRLKGEKFKASGLLEEYARAGRKFYSE
jgi:3-hydroxyacyl-CoA dehydrogenase / enoyl-CoA hydratase / 3-hydroxybutyryl-CoA epimerase